MEMKKLKKLVSILLAAVLVFGVAATGFAAAPEAVVLEEVTAETAAPEVDAPVVEDQPVAEVAADVTSSIVYTVKSTSTTPIPGAVITLKLSADQSANGTFMANGVDIADGTATTTVTTGTDGTAKVNFVASADTVTGANVEATVAAGTTPLKYAAVTTAVEVVVTDGAAIGATKDIALAEADSGIGYVGTISGTVTKDGAPVPNLTLSITPTNGTPQNNITTNSSGVYTFTAGASDKLGAYTAKVVSPISYAISGTDAITITPATTGAETLNLTVNATNTVTVMDGTTPIKGVYVASSNGATALTDEKGVALFGTNITAGAGVTFTVNGGFNTQTNKRYFTSTSTPAVTVSADGKFPATSVNLSKAPSLADLVVKGPTNQGVVTAGTAKFTVDITANGFTSAEFDPATQAKIQWQYFDIATNKWVNLSGAGVTDATTATVSIDTGASGGAAVWQKTGAQFRAVLTVKDAGYIETLNPADTANCQVTPAAMLTVGTGIPIKGAIMTGSGATIAPLSGVKAASIQIFTAEEFAKGDKAVELDHATADTSAAGAYQFTKEFLPGNYVIKVIDTPSGASPEFWGTTLKAYTGATLNVTVTESDIKNIATTPAKTVDNITLSPKDAITINTQPYNKSVAIGGAATFTAVATSNWGTNASTPAALTFAWSYSTNGGKTWSPATGVGTTATTPAGSVYTSVFTVTSSLVTANLSGAMFKAEITSAGAGSPKLETKSASLNVTPYVAPMIAAQPQNATAVVQRPAEFKATVSGSNAASVTPEWQISVNGGTTWSAIPNGGMYTYGVDPDNSAIKTLKVTQGNIAMSWNGYMFRLKVTDTTPPAGVTPNPEATSEAATLTVTDVVVPITIANLNNVTVTRNRGAEFNIGVNGTMPYKAQLYFSNDNGLTFAKDGVETDWSYDSAMTLTSTKIAGSTAKVGDLYQIRVWGLDEKVVVSNTVSITEITNPVAVAIATNPSDASVADNREVVFTATVTGSGPYTYQWQKTKTPATEASWTSVGVSETTSKTQSTLKFDATKADDGFYYRLKVTNNENSATGVFSAGAKLAVTDVIAPSITTQPGDQTGAVGGTVTLSVVAGGTAPFTYQWYVMPVAGEWTAIAGATADSYTTPVLADTDNGNQYKVVVTSKEGDFVESNAAKLTVSSAITSAEIIGTDSVYVGKTAQYMIDVEPEGAEFMYDFYIADSNKEKAEITGDGMLTAKKQGIIKVYAEITGADGERIVISQKVSIKKATTSFGLKSKENRVILYKGGNGSPKYPWYTQLVLTNVKPSGASSSVKDMIWTTSDKRVATVENGKVKVASGAGSRLGTVIITATDKGNPNSIATYILKVTKA